jgi:hypothetical protein
MHYSTLKQFKDVDHILHAVDVDDWSAIEGLEQIVSVIAAQSFPVNTHSYAVGHGE